jgi:hypothetical protein
MRSHDATAGMGEGTKGARTGVKGVQRRQCGSVGSSKYGTRYFTEVARRIRGRRIILCGNPGGSVKAFPPS